MSMSVMRISRWTHALDPSTVARMNTDGERADDALGGRLTLLPLDGMTEQARTLVRELTATRGAAGRDAGYATALPDGRLIGPFNALVRVPSIAGPHLAWANAIAASPVPSDVREVIVLAVAAEWRADYERYAHERAARAAGFTQAVIEAIGEGREPAGLDPRARAAYCLAVALVRDHDVDDAVYGVALQTFGEPVVVALVELIGQYLVTSALLTCFRVPAPAD